MPCLLSGDKNVKDLEYILIILERIYDQIFDMILGLFVIDKYLKNKNNIDELKRLINQYER